MHPNGTNVYKLALASAPAAEKKLHWYAVVKVYSKPFQIGPIWGTSEDLEKVISELGASVIEWRERVVMPTHPVILMAKWSNP